MELLDSVQTADGKIFTVCTMKTLSANEWVTIVSPYNGLAEQKSGRPLLCYWPSMDNATLGHKSICLQLYLCGRTFTVS